MREQPVQGPNMNLIVRYTTWIFGLMILKCLLPPSRSESAYRPDYSAVYAFAICKGHRYSTCVMDLVKGDILLVEKGRTVYHRRETFNWWFNDSMLPFTEGSCPR